VKIITGDFTCITLMINLLKTELWLDKTCSTHDTSEKSVYSFDWKILKEIGLFERHERKYSLFFRPTNTLYIYTYIYIYIYIYNIFVSTPTCFSASASSSGGLNLVRAKVTKVLKLLKLQLNIPKIQHLLPEFLSPIWVDPKVCSADPKDPQPVSSGSVDTFL
jgi:hypothetical protein